MGTGSSQGIRTARLDTGEYAENFAELHPALSDNLAAVEADRCFFCYDAPCTIACPTSIDIPMFIRKIAVGNRKGAARTIIDSNILGGMCARVCPVETLCEQACVHIAQGNEAVKIGQLQRYATDSIIDDGAEMFSRPEATGKKIAMVGAGPASLACAHNLACEGHEITIFEARSKPGGLNEYGLAAYKTTSDFAQAEVEFVLAVGGIEIRYDTVLGRDITLAELSENYDAVFIGIGLAETSKLGIEGEDLAGIGDAIDYIAVLRQSDDLSSLPVGDNVVVIGGGMTAIDIAVQSKKLGAENVTIAYRRGPEQMGASRYEQELALTNGVVIKHWVKPVKAIGDTAVSSLELERTRYDDNGKLVGTGEKLTIPADQLFRAIGQKFSSEPIENAGIEMKWGRISVDESCKTSLANVWAGGDCIAGGEDLTVAAVNDGNVAARSISEFLKTGGAS